MSIFRGLLILCGATLAAAGLIMLAVLFNGLMAGTVGWLFQFPVASWFDFAPIPWWVWVCGAILTRVLIPTGTVQQPKEKKAELAQPGLPRRW